MSIRSAAKAVIMRDGCVLLNKCEDSALGIYYDLPGGGQNQYETLAEAVVRECREETGLTVTVGRFLALCEEIWEGEAMRAEFPDYTHRIYHIFECSLADEAPAKISEGDYQQVASEWIPIGEVQKLKLFYPQALAGVLAAILADGVPRFLGTAVVK